MSLQSFNALVFIFTNFMLVQSLLQNILRCFGEYGRIKTKYIGECQMNSKQSQVPASICSLWEQQQQRWTCISMVRNMGTWQVSTESKYSGNGLFESILFCYVKKKYLPKSESGEKTFGKFSAGCHKGNQIALTISFFLRKILTIRYDLTFLNWLCCTIAR